MDHDLSKCKVGDWIWTIKFGWVKININNRDSIYPITILKKNKYYAYTYDGKFDITDNYPSAFVVPPKEFNAGEPPCEFKKGDKVLVSNSNASKWTRRYFSHKEDGFYYCFAEGKDEWASYGVAHKWIYCKKWEEE